MVSRTFGELGRDARMDENFVTLVLIPHWHPAANSDGPQGFRRRHKGEEYGQERRIDWSY